MKKIVLLIVLVFVVTACKPGRPIPGEKVSGGGVGNHVAVGTPVEYSTDPPTSGPHYADWIRKGVFSEPKDDRNIVHSLEHGYVVLYYQCDPGAPQPEATDSGQGQLTCEQRQQELKKIYDEKGEKKLIVVPRTNLETNYVATAWEHIYKFGEINQEDLFYFIDKLRDHGPEKTME